MAAMKTAILQMADAGPVESTAVMLHAVGYRVYLPNDHLRAALRDAGCDTVLSPRDLTRGMGYDPIDFPEVGPEAMETCDLFCDIKAHRSYSKIVARWPRLAGRILWTRINGGRPEHVVNASGDHGDEVNPPCPVLTPNQWYSCNHEDPDNTGSCVKCQSTEMRFSGVPGAYTCWPPFVRFDEYGRVEPVSDTPVCLIHGMGGWGYGALVEPLRALGVRMYGAGSPDGLVRHQAVPPMLAKALCMVHLKSSDAPGYSLLEALASACPVVCTRRLIWRCRMQELLVPGETCLVFDRETHDGLTDDDVRECTREVGEHLERLRDPAENRRIGENGRNRLREVMWRVDRDGPGLVEFMERNFA